MIFEFNMMTKMAHVKKERKQEKMWRTFSCSTKVLTMCPENVSRFIACIFAGWNDINTSNFRPVKLVQLHQYVQMLTK